MGSESHAGMTSKALRAFLVWRDLGPTRTYGDACELLGYSRKSDHLLQRWAKRYNWGQLIVEHDHLQLRDALGQREIIREKAQQVIIDRMIEAAGKLYDIMADERQTPVFDRHGAHMKDGEGNFLYRPFVKASTQREAAKDILGIGGLVPVKRMIHEDKTGEDLDRATRVLASLTPSQLATVAAMLEDDDGAA